MARNKASRKNKTTTITPLKETNLVFKKKNIEVCSILACLNFEF